MKGKEITKIMAGMFITILCILSFGTIRVTAEPWDGYIDVTYAKVLADSLPEITDWNGDYNEDELAVNDDETVISDGWHKDTVNNRYIFFVDGIGQYQSEGNPYLGVLNGGRGSLEITLCYLNEFEKDGEVIIVFTSDATFNRYIVRVPSGAHKWTVNLPVGYYKNVFITSSNITGFSDYPVYPDSFVIALSGSIGHIDAIIGDYVGGTAEDLEPTASMEEIETRESVTEHSEKNQSTAAGILSEIESEQKSSEKERNNYETVITVAIIAAVVLIAVVIINAVRKTGKNKS